MWWWDWRKRWLKECRLFGFHRQKEKDNRTLQFLLSLVTRAQKTDLVQNLGSTHMKAYIGRKLGNTRKQKCNFTLTHFTANRWRQRRRYCWAWRKGWRQTRRWRWCVRFAGVFRWLLGKNLVSAHNNRNAETFYPNQWDVLVNLANAMLMGSWTATNWA